MALKSPFVEFVCRQFDSGVPQEDIRVLAEAKFKTPIQDYKIDIAIKNFEKGLYKLPVSEIEETEAIETKEVSDGNPNQ